MRTCFLTIPLAAALALSLTGCVGESPTRESVSEPVATTTPPEAVPTPSATPSAAQSVDNAAIGEAWATNAVTTRAILEGVWKDTPQAKREGTCARWASTPTDIYTIPLFAGMDRAFVKSYFDEVCRNV